MRKEAMTMRTIITTTIFGFVLALTACDKGDPAKADKAKTAKAADSGDMGAFTEKFGPLGGSCKGCHTDFRIKK